MQLAGHGKDPRCLQVELSIVPKEEKSLPEQTFKVGDLVYQDNPDKTGIISKISRGKALVNIGGDRTAIVPLAKIHHCDPKYSPKPKKSQEEIFAEEEKAIAKAREEYLKQRLKVGDRIRHRDGFIGEVIFVSDRCINVKGQNSVKSYNLEQVKDFSASVEILPVETDFAISISGEAIIYEPNAKLVELKGTGLRIAENRELHDLLNPICNWYCGRDLAIFAVNALGHALEFARDGKIAEAVELLNTEVMAEIKKPPTEVRKLKKFLDNFVHSIDAVKLPVFEQAIAPESTKSVANLRMDESKASVLVEIDVSTGSTTKPVLVENERLTFLLEQREKLIASGASPKGVWLNIGKVPKRDFVQVVWKADKPHAWLGNAKSRYIGKLNSDEHKSAIAQHRAGQELRKIERELKKLQMKS